MSATARESGFEVLCTTSHPVTAATFTATYPTAGTPTEGPPTSSSDERGLALTQQSLWNSIRMDAAMAQVEKHCSAGKRRASPLALVIHSLTYAMCASRTRGLCCLC